MTKARINVEHDQEAAECSPPEPGLWRDNAHLEPSRWWFLSSVFPLIAGTLGPVASAFSICALAQPWRQHLVPGGDIQEASFITDPPWLTAANAVQLAVAIVSNVFLLFNMARRVRFSIAQPITILGWYISAIVLISLTATASGPLLEGIEFIEDELIWSQSFYYAIWAAILYFIDASLMAVTFWGAASGHYQKEFKLTSSQRTLMLQTIMLLIYIHLGARIFCSIEGWGYLDAVYWADVSLFTIGFGDYAPETTLGRALVIPYALIGITSLGLVIGAVRSLTLEGGRQRLTARMEEKIRQRTIRKMLHKGNDEILEPVRRESEAFPAPSSQISAEFSRRKAEFSLMRKIQSKCSFRKRWTSLVISAGAWLILWLIGAVVFEKAERHYQNWTYFESFYFCFEAWTTIGYGDLTPVSNAGKSFFVFWSTLALPIMTILISHAGNTVIKFVRNGVLRLGNVTILPGDESFLGNMKHIMSKMTFGKTYPRYFKSASPGNLFKSSSQGIKPSDGIQDDRGHQATAFSSRTLSSNMAYNAGRHTDDKLPTGSELHLLLVSEVRTLATHLKTSKSRCYTFDEWAWYLKLMGEDERNHRTHCKVRSIEKRYSLNEGLNEDSMWSWVGHHNPLIDSQEESTWILERLVNRLQELLLADSRQQQEKHVDE
ncbi:Outward-rectifier potassium channel TOK1-like protein [Cladobotryum mycophilum]|uniref:Outward-rectifier potassium channel TOK1-like protein n=1 Tax=Cladobotryum mycophilum TaxID=491253 RepID=A0ABR0SI50_9HYPO